MCLLKMTRERISGWFSDHAGHDNITTTRYVPLPLHPHPRPAMYAQRTIRRTLNILERQLREPGAVFTSSSSVSDWLHLQLTQEQRKEFFVLWPDNQHRLIAYDTLFLGAINTTTVHPHEIVKTGLKHNTTAAVLAHNHSSGLAESSHADRQMTDG